MVVWDAATAAPIRTLSPEALQGRARCARFYPRNPSLALLGTSRGELEVFNCSTGTRALRNAVPSAFRHSVEVTGVLCDAWLCLWAAACAAVVLDPGTRALRNVVPAAFGSPFKATGVVHGCAGKTHLCALHSLKSACGVCGKQKCGVGVSTAHARPPPVPARSRGVQPP